MTLPACAKKWNLVELLQQGREIHSKSADLADTRFCDWSKKIRVMLIYAYFTHIFELCWYYADFIRILWEVCQYFTYVNDAIRSNDVWFSSGTKNHLDWDLAHTARSDPILSHIYLLWSFGIMAQMWHDIIFLAINQQRWLQTLFLIIWEKL